MIDLLRKIELRVDLFILWPLCDEERITRGALSDWGVETENELDVEIVDLWKEKDPMDRGERDAVVRTFAKQS